MTRDLPREIGQPAHRALASIGITTLDGCQDKTDRELLALHGFGPKALRTIRQALNQQQ